MDARAYDRICRFLQIRIFSDLEGNALGYRRYTLNDAGTQLKVRVGYLHAALGSVSVCTGVITKRVEVTATITTHLYDIPTVSAACLTPDCRMIPISEDRGGPRIVRVLELLALFESLPNASFPIAGSFPRLAAVWR